MKQYFQISCHALTGTAFLALSLTGQLDSLTLAIFVPAFLLSFYRTVANLPPLLGARGAFYLSCGYLVFFLFDLGVLSGSIVPATVHMVLFLELAKLFQEKTDKDYLYLIILAFLQILAASSLTVDMSFIVTLLLFLVALVSTLMSFDMYRSGRASSLAERETSSSLGSMSVWATAGIIAFGAVIFFVIPRAGTGYFTRATVSPLLLSGFGENVALGQIGQVKLGSAVVMHARRLSGTPFAVLKWRGVALDTFDGRLWSKSDRTRRSVPRSNTTYQLVSQPALGEIARYEILLEPLATTTIFGPRRIRTVSSRFIRGLESDESDSIYMRVEQSRRVQYDVESEIPGRVRDRAGNDLTAEDLNTVDPSYLQLPEDLDEEVIDLARTITEDGESVREKAVLVEAYLKRNYTYSLTLDWNPGLQPVTTFLLDSKSGHCEYFASSMAILLRAAGIPTRIVNGFLMGEYNPVGDAYVVRQSDAHSWVEAYIPGSGWTEFDPTPPEGIRSEAGWMAQVRHYLDAVELFWNSYVLTYDTDSQTQLFQSAQEHLQHFQRALQENTEEWAAWTDDATIRLTLAARGILQSGWAWLLAAFAAVAGLTFYYRAALLARWRLWKLRTGRAATGDEITETVSFLFYRAARLAGAGAADRRSGQTWREWLATLSHPERRSVLSRALGVFENAKYGGRESSPEDVVTLEQAIRELRSLLQYPGAGNR